MTGTTARDEARAPRWARALRWWDTHASALAVGAIVLSLILSCGYALVLGERIRYEDEHEYLELTRSLAEGRGFAYGQEVTDYAPYDQGVTAYRPPGLPFLLTPLWLATGGSVLALRLVGIIALASATWLAFLLGRRVHSAGAGALAAIGVGCYPLFVYSATAFYPQIPAMAMLLLFIEASHRVADHDAARQRCFHAVAAGIAGGLLVLLVPPLGVCIPPVLLWVAMTRTPSARCRPLYRCLAGALVLAVVIPGAWTVRNVLSMGAFIPISTNTGINLLLGNSEKVSARTGSAGDIDAYIHHALDNDLDEVATNDFFTASAVNWIVAHPADAAALYGRKVLYTFAHSNELYTETGTTSFGGVRHNAMTDLVSALTFYPMLALMFVRIGLAWRSRLNPTEKMLVTLIAGNILLIAVFIARIRLRLPLDGLMIILAASAVGHLIAMTTAKHPR